MEVLDYGWHDEIYGPFVCAAFVINDLGAVTGHYAKRVGVCVVAGHESSVQEMLVTVQQTSLIKAVNQAYVRQASTLFFPASTLLPATRTH